MTTKQTNQNPTNITIVILGEPSEDIDVLRERFEMESEPRIIDSLAELTDAGELTDVAHAVSCMLFLARNGVRLYLAQPIEGLERRVINETLKLKPDFVIDEALEVLRKQIEGEPVGGPDEFIDAVGNAFDAFNVTFEKVVFTDAEDDNEVRFHPHGRLSQPHTIKWCDDGAVELDGAILRPTAVMGNGHHLQELLGGKVLTPGEVLRFIANRLAVNGAEDLVGYGRAFGPGKEDITNATLTPRSRKFRSTGLVGVVAASAKYVRKAKADMVIEVARHLRALNYIVFLHQQCKELYVGQDAVEAFRGTVEENGKVTLYGKSTKHTRVDAGAYCLYTENNGYVDIPAIIGVFEEANDGSVYAPRTLLEGISGYLKETVKAVKDFNKMTPDLIQRYYTSSVMVNEGDRIEPGDTVFTVDGQEHKWVTKADYGIVRTVIDEATTKMVRIEVRIDAYFTQDLKIRGFGKGLVCPSEAAGISSKVLNHADGTEDTTPRMIIGAPGIIKDSAAAKEYILDPQPVIGGVTTQYCKRDYELAKLKHNPVPLTQFEKPIAGKWAKKYGESIVLHFNDEKRTITTWDVQAIACTIRVQIEASPVGQSVGSSGMTMPQMAWLSSLPAGNEWLKETALEGVLKRTDALAYLHAVAGQIPVA